MKSRKLIQLKYSELKPLKRKLHKKQNKICPILKKKFPLRFMVIDHKHKNKKEPIGLEGKGLVRGAIHFQANSLEGKMYNAYIRYGLHKFISFQDFLRNLADYYEKYENKPTKWIHPSEKPDGKKLGKRLFNKLNKLYCAKYPKRKPLQYPKGRGKKVPTITVKWERLLKEFDLED